MKNLVRQIGWQFLVLLRNNLISVSAMITILYGIMFFFIKDIEGSEKVLALLIFNDPAIISMFFFGLMVISERSESVFGVHMISPQSIHTYILSRLLVLCVIGSTCAILMALFMLGTNVDWLFFTLGVFSTCFIFGLTGVLIVSYIDEFLKFMLVSIPILMILGAPLYPYFDLIDGILFRFQPLQGSFDLINHSMTGGWTTATIVGAVVKLLIWSGVFYAFAFRNFRQRLKNNS